MSASLAVLLIRGNFEDLQLKLNFKDENGNSKYKWSIRNSAPHVCLLQVPLLDDFGDEFAEETSHNQLR